MVGLISFDLDYIISQPWLLLVFLFQIWMLVDAVRREEWVWAAFILFFSGLSAALYFFMVYRASASPTQGFEFPGAHKRKRIKELEASIHHLDKAHHHLELGDIYFQQGKLAKAEACYRASIERDPTDLDARAHLGQCLLRLNRAADACELLQKVCLENQKHDYGYSLMGYAESLMALGDKKAAIETLKMVLQDHSYARARVQLGELYAKTNQPDLAKPELREVLSDDTHAPSYQRKRDRFWVRKAKRLLKEIQ